ncbi:MAG: response regulator transcription factor [Pseudomonadota bacterium]|uniref:response regulator transcription factor n=1 Tax=Halomonas alkaliantarctica TaxID=232346 RepID=UPI0004AAA5B6|nr:response regulator transcription factor [Halomonas alkaliantarctica]
MRIAVLEDDLDQLDFIGRCLEGDRHDVVLMHRAGELHRHLQTERFDLLILDWHLPDASGLEVMAHLRHGHAWQQPILFITAAPREDAVVTALEAGADDFLHKPLHPAELRARVNALGRRTPHLQKTADALSLGEYQLLRVPRGVVVGGESVPLTEREYQLVNLFFTHPGQLLSRHFLLELVWGLQGDVQTRTLDTHISRVRRKLELDGSFGLRLHSVYQYGYRLEEVRLAHQA